MPLRDQEINEHVGKRLRFRRRILGLSQTRVGDKCGVTFQQIQKYECGANRMSVALLFKLSESLQVPISYFFEGLDTRFAVPTEQIPDRVNKYGEEGVQYERR